MTLCVLVCRYLDLLPRPHRQAGKRSALFPQTVKKEDLRAGTIKANKDPSIVKPVHSGMFGRFEKVPAANM